jgi:threonine synthase
VTRGTEPLGEPRDVLEPSTRFSAPGERYFSLLPVRDRAMLSTLGEGNTPLVPSRYLARELGLPHLYFKLETTNPSGSYKDRLMACEVSLMREAGCTACLGPSTGNAGASLAAYAARFDLRCFIYATEMAEESKLHQMLFHGARVQRIRGFGSSPDYTEKVFAALQGLAARNGAHLVCSAFRYNPVAMEAVKTISFEICEQLGSAPDQVFVPIAGGGLLSAMAKGFREFFELGRADLVPKLNGVQSAGCPTVVRGVRGGALVPAQASTTTIGTLAAPFAPDAELALRSILDSGGWGYEPRDEEILAAQSLLAVREGIFAEPIAAASVAGVIRAREENRVDSRERIVCLISGHGFKDPQSVASANRKRPVPSLSLEELLAAPLPSA